MKTILCLNLTQLVMMGMRVWDPDHTYMVVKLMYVDHARSEPVQLSWSCKLGLCNDHVVHALMSC